VIYWWRDGDFPFSAKAARFFIDQLFQLWLGIDGDWKFLIFAPCFRTFLEGFFGGL
jgi:hypothetical protein